MSWHRLYLCRGKAAGKLWSALGSGERFLDFPHWRLWGEGARRSQCSVSITENAGYSSLLLLQTIHDQ